jgi:hypothetical protein
MATLAERERRRKLEDEASKSFYERNIGGMFAPAVDPNAPKVGENIGGLPSYMNPALGTNQLMGGASVVDGNIVPGAGNKPGMFDTSPNIRSQEAFGSTYNPNPSLQGQVSYDATGRPSFTREMTQQPIKLNPSYTSDLSLGPFDKSNMVARADLNEYNLDGSLDRNLGGLGGQDTVAGEIYLGDLTNAGKTKFNESTKLIQEYKQNNSPGALPFGEKYDSYQKGLNKILDTNTLTVLDLNETGKGKFNIINSVDAKGNPTGGFENTKPGSAGGAYVPGGTDGPVMKGRAYEGGDTLEDTLKNAQMTMDGRPTAEGLQYTGQDVMQSFPARRDAITGGGGIIADPEVYNMFQPGGQYGKAAEGAAAAGGLLDGVGGITGAVGLLGDIMLMQSLLDNKQKPTPGAGIPRGQAGAKIQVEDPYKRRF